MTATQPRPDICALIPTYNNAGTIADVVGRTLAQGLDVLVVDDGSTDGTSEILKELPVKLFTHPKNKGKGGALKTGLGAARELGYSYAIALDADGQHFPEDIPLLAAACAPDTIVVGSRDLEAEGMPSGNTFANRFSNFWFTVQTGVRLPDTQTGFRAYSLADLPSLRLLSSRYEAELSLLVFSAWRGVGFVSVPVRVCYPEDRVSHFRPFADFLRISLLNTVLCLLAIVWGYPRKFLRMLKK